MALRLTFELYLDAGDGGRPTFEALTCADEVELVRVLRRMIEDRRLAAIEARRLGEHVVTLTS